MLKAQNLTEAEGRKARELTEFIFQEVIEGVEGVTIGGHRRGSAAATREAQLPAPLYPKRRRRPNVCL